MPGFVDGGTTMKAKPLALAAAAMVVLSALAPVAAALGTVDSTSDGIGVETLPETNVTNSSATLNGNLTSLGNASNATVWFEYWEMNDSGNASPSNEETLENLGEFSARVGPLDPNTTYVYAAHAEANNTTVSGSTVTLTTGASAEDGNSSEDERNETFGQEVSAFVHDMQIEIENGHLSVPLGQVISAFVTENTPGNVPTFAGPSDRDEADDRGSSERASGHGESEHPGNGPPEHAQNNTDGNGADGNVTGGEENDGSDGKNGNDGNDNGGNGNGNGGNGGKSKGNDR